MRPIYRTILGLFVVAGVLTAVLVIERLRSTSTQSASPGFYSLSEPGIELGTAGDSPAELERQAPDFTLLGLNGAPVSLRSLRGKTVLINFWATWCAPCRQEMPDINEAFLKRQDVGFVVLAVNLKETPSQAKAFADKYGLAFTVLLDAKGDVAKAYQLTGVPESWIIGSDGVLRERKIGVFSRRELPSLIDGNQSLKRQREVTPRQRRAGRDCRCRSRGRTRWTKIEMPRL